MALQFYKDEALQLEVGYIFPLSSQQVSTSWTTEDYTYQEGEETKTIKLAHSNRASETISSAEDYTMIAPADAGLTTRTDDYTYIYSETGIRIGLRMVVSGTNGGYYQITYPEKKVNGSWTRLPVWSGDMTARWSMIEFDNVVDTSASNYTIMKGLTFSAVTVSINGKSYTCLTPVVVCAERSNPGATLFRAGGDHIYVDQEALAVGSTEKPDAYKPKNNVKSGGRGTGGMSGAGRAEHFDLAARNMFFSFGSLDGTGLTYYIIQRSTIHQILAWAYSWGIERDNSYLRSCIVSAVMVPGDPSAVASSNRPIQIADKFQRGVNGDILGQRFYKIANPKKVYLSTDANGDFSDFTQMEIQLILPFVGVINLDPRVCAGEGTLFSIEAWSDAYTGNVLYYVYTKTNEENSNEILYGTYSGNGGVSLPIVGGGASGSYLQYVQNRNNTIATGLQSAGSMIMSVATNPLGAAAAGLGLENAALELQKMQSPPLHIDKGGTVDPNASAMLPNTIAINYTIPVRVDPNNYQAEEGLPCCIYKTVSELTTPGRYTFSALMVDDISDASEAEKQKIRSILTKGVIVA